MGSLHYISALRFGSASESEDRFALVNLEALRKVKVHGIPLLVNGYPTLDRQHVISNYSSWIINTNIFPLYDVFISHRWNEDDDVIVDLLYDALLGYTVGQELREVRVFLDKVRLKEGRQFQTAFGSALISSTIFVPIFSTAALRKMQEHKPEDEDNVLIEWMLTLECMKDLTNSKIRMVFPLVFGERKEDGSVGNLHVEGVIDRLPEVVPTASIAVVKTLLEKNGVDASHISSNCTVRRIVKDLAKFNGILCWTAPLNTCIQKSSCQIVELADELSTVV